MTKFPTQIRDCDSGSPALLDLFISSSVIYSAVAFPLLGNFDHAVPLVCIDFLLYSKRDAPFHCKVYESF